MWGVGGGKEKTINMPISREGSGMPTMRPQTGSLGQEGGLSCGGVGGGEEKTITCQYPEKVQACPPWDHRPALWGRREAYHWVVGGGGWGGGKERTINMPISREGSGMPTMRPQTSSLGQEGGLSLGGGGWGVGRGKERTINMPISREGSGMPTMRPQTGSLGQAAGLPFLRHMYISYLTRLSEHFNFHSYFMCIYLYHKYRHSLCLWN